MIEFNKTSQKFSEKQQFRQKGMWAVYILLSGLLALFIYACIQQMILGIPFGEKPAPDFVLLLVTFFLLAFLILLYSATLETQITGNGVSFRWLPFKKHFRQIRWDDIDEADIIKYPFVGNGWRLSPFGTVHNVGGNQGLRLILKNGSKLIIGTQKPVELAEFLRRLKKLTGN